MITKSLLLAAGSLWVVGTTALGQTVSVHQFSAIGVQPDGAVLLTLNGGVPSSLRNYYDLFPIESSLNLRDWTPLATLFRTNASTNDISFATSVAPDLTQRFYRTPTNGLTTPIPRPSGRYPVGTISRLFTDPSRTNRYGITTNSSFVVQFWYPAEPGAGVLPAPYLDPRIASTWYGNYTQNRISANPALFKAAVSHALPDVPIASDQAAYPVVIFSHGYQCIRTMDTDVMENLASDGYITVAIDHFDAFASVFPDGRVVHGNAPNLPITVAQNIFNLQSRARDVQFVLDELTRMDQEDTFFGGRFDVQHVGIFGHSLGGAIAADACAADSRIRAGLSLDGGGHTNLLALQITQPFLIASGDDSNPVMKPYRAAFRSLFDELTRDAYWLQITNSQHLDFVESPWFASSPVPSKLRTATVLRIYIRSFFNKYLKGQDDHFLDGPPVDYPEVDSFLKK